MMALLMAVVALWASAAMAGVNEDLCLAAWHGDLREVKRLIAKGADVNAKVSKYGLTALMHASMNGDREVMQELLSKGAEVNAKNNDGRTALMFASIWDHPQVVQELLSRGAEVNARDNQGKTALMLVSRRGVHLGVKRLLIKAGAK